MDSQNDDLIRLLRGELAPDDRASVMSKAAGDLDRFLTENLTGKQAVFDLLSRRLSTIDRETWGTVYNGLIAYLGTSAGILVIWTLSADPQSNLQELQGHASPRVMDFFRNLIGFLAPELALAYSVWNEPPDDWRNISSDIFYDNRRRRALFRLRIDKNNGQTVTLEMVSRSMLRLIGLLMKYAREQQTPDAFEKDGVGRLLDEANALVEFLSPRQQSVKASGEPQQTEAVDARRPMPSSPAAPARRPARRS